MFSWNRKSRLEGAEGDELQALFTEIEGLLRREEGKTGSFPSIGAPKISSPRGEGGDILFSVSRPGASRPSASQKAQKKKRPDLLEADFPLDHSNYDALEDALRTRDESFSHMLLRLIDESGMTDPQCYKAAHITAQHFSKIRTNPEHKPDKITVLKFAVALKLSEEDAETLLRSAGFGFSPHNNFDIIMRYFFRKRIYDMYTIDRVLYHFDEPVLCGLK